MLQSEAHRAGDSGSNPGPGENFSPKLTAISSDQVSDILLKHEIDV